MAAARVDGARGAPGSERRGHGRAAQDRADRRAHLGRPSQRTAPHVSDRPRRALAGGAPRGTATDLVSHSAFAHLHPTGGHPESQQRIAVLHERFPFVECTPATADDVLRCHTNDLIEKVRTTRGWLDADTLCTETT